MRTVEKVMVEKEVTTYTCDICGWNTTNNNGCCGSAPIMKCDLCRQDACQHNGHFHQFEESDFWTSDYPDITMCTDCLPQGEKSWKIARAFAPRYADIREFTIKVFNNYDEWKEWEEDVA